MKNRKRQLLIMAEALLLGVTIVFQNQIPYGHIILLVIGWYKLIIAAIMLISVFALGILEMLRES